MESARDRFWLWGHEPGSHDREWNLPGPSRITPIEAAFYMGIPNVIMVRYGEGPVRYGEGPVRRGETAVHEDRRYTLPFSALGSVVWSIVGAAGTTSDRERAQVLELSDRLPNLSGFMMDDFFLPPGGRAAVLSTAHLEEIRTQLVRGERRLDLWVVLYDHQLVLPVEQHLRLCDIVSFWTWRASELEHLERNFARVEKIAPTCRKVLGCYMWDYGDKRPMPVEAMQRQATTGLRWLREGRIEGMIFLASCICDLELETVEWTREWIARVGDERL